MADQPLPSVKFLQSEGTPQDFEEFWRADPIGAAQYATGLALANQEHFEGLEEMQQVLESTEPIEQVRQRLKELGERRQSIFTFVAKKEEMVRSREETLGWKASDPQSR